MLLKVLKLGVVGYRVQVPGMQQLGTEMKENYKRLSLIKTKIINMLVEDGKYDEFSSMCQLMARIKRLESALRELARPSQVNYAKNGNADANDAPQADNAHEAPS